jgi:hypothetical protein
MRVYMYDERTNGALQALCVSLGIEVITHEDILSKRRAMSSAAPQFFLQEVDLLIIETTQPTQEMQFIIAQALLTQKPTLCLYAKNYPPRELLNFIKQQPQPRSIKTFSYVSQSLPAAVRRFLRMHSDNTNDRDDFATIKYTLRLTPRVDRYLQWRADATHESKADVIRSLLLDLAQSDTTYRDTEILFDDE